MSLALKYRPRTFEDVVGQKAVSVILSAMIKQEKLAPVLLFTGPSGVGKTSMARIVAAALNPDSVEDVHNRNHMFVKEIDGASNGSVEAIRSLKVDLSYQSMGHTVIIIDEVHAISSNAFDALKDMLETGFSHVTFILCTTEEHKLEKAIRHRCDRYAFKLAGIDDLISRMQHVASSEGINVSTELLEALAHRSEGSFREALMMLDQVWAGNITTVGEYNELHGDIDFGPGLIESTLRGPANALDKLESILRYTNTEEITDRTVETLRDLIMLRGGVTPNMPEHMLETRTKLAKKFDLTMLVKGISIVWDLKTKLAETDSVRGLEMVYAMLGQIFKQEEIKIVAPKPQESNELSFEDLKRLTAEI